MVFVNMHVVFKIISAIKLIPKWHLINLNIFLKWVTVQISWNEIFLTTFPVYVLYTFHSLSQTCSAFIYFSVLPKDIYAHYRLGNESPTLWIKKQWLKHQQAFPNKRRHNCIKNVLNNMQVETQQSPKLYQKLWFLCSSIRSGPQWD